MFWVVEGESGVTPSPPRLGETLDAAVFLCPKGN